MGTKVYDNALDLITFSRASGGTALRKISYGSELVTNGTFDTDTSGWASNGASALTNEGGRLRVTNSVTGFGRALQTVSGFTVGKVYLFSAEFLATSGIIARATITGLTGLPDTSASATTISYVFVATLTSHQLSIGSNSNTIDGWTEWDNISVKEVLFDQPDGTLTLFNHPTNIPRIEYDAAGTVKGLLIEEQRTNLLSYSEDFANAAWAGLSVTHTADQVGPDGVTNSAYTLTDTASAIAVFGQTLACADDTLARTFSVFAKKTVSASTFPGISIFYSGGTAVNSGITLNTDTGVATARVGGGIDAPDAFTSEDFGDYWRFSVTVSNNGAGNTSVLGYISPAVNTDGSAAWTSLTGSFVAFGAQLEAGSFATSYISTSGIAATRSADIASIPTSAFGYNQKAGTVVVEWNSDDATAHIANFYTDASNRWVILKDAGNQKSFVSDGGTAVMNSVIASAPSGDNKSAMSISLNSGNGVINGGTVVSDTSVSVPVVSNLAIGKDEASNYYLNGHIKSIQYYPRRLANTQLQELTA